MGFDIGWNGGIKLLGICIWRRAGLAKKVICQQVVMLSVDSSVNSQAFF